MQGKARRRFPVAKYLFQASYTKEGLDGLMKEGGSKRRKAVEKAVKGMGGKLEAFYYAFGHTDVFCIADLPGNVDAGAFALRVAASGGATVKTTVLITPEEVDEAVKKSIDYRPPLGGYIDGEL
jgi:uncharacterized protein with GYD domain